MRASFSSSETLLASDTKLLNEVFIHAITRSTKDKSIALQSSESVENAKQNIFRFNWAQNILNVKNRMERSNELIDTFDLLSNGVLTLIVGLRSL